LRCVWQITPSYGGWGRRTAKRGFFQGTHYGTDERLASWQQRGLCVGSKMMTSPDKQCRSRLPIHYGCRCMFSVEARTNQGLGRRASSASFHRSRCPQMLVTAQNTIHMEHSLNVLEFPPEGVARVSVPSTSVSVALSVGSSWAESGRFSAFRRRITEISERHVLARLRKQLVSSAEQNRSMRVSSAKIHRICTSVGV